MKFNFKFLFIASLTILLLSECRKSYIRHHYEGQFNCTEHYRYHDINNNIVDTVYYYSCTVSLFPDYPEEYLDDNRKTIPIQIKRDGTSGYIQTEISRNGDFKSANFSHGSFSGGYTDDDHFSYTLTDGGLGSSYTETVTAIRK